MGKFKEKLSALWRNYADLISYLFFGALTTAVNYLIYLPCYNYLKLSGSVSNMVAWTGAVAFAYLTNKPFVFKSNDWSMKTVLPELGRFVTCRLASGILETGIIFVTVDRLSWNGNIMKLLTSVLVVVVNYVASKLVVFRGKGK